MAKLAHPHVMPLFDVVEADGRVAFVMAYVEGETLRAWLERGPHPWPDVLARFIAAARGLAAAHAAGIVHRDFKASHPDLGQALLQKAMTLELDQRYREAEALLLEAEQIAERSHSNTLAMMVPTRLLGLFLTMRDDSKARTYAARAWALLDYPTRTRLRGRLLIELARFELRLGDPGNARSCIVRLRRLVDSSPDPDPRVNAQLLAEAARLLEQSQPRTRKGRNHA